MVILIVVIILIIIALILSYILFFPSTVSVSEEVSTESDTSDNTTSTSGPTFMDNLKGVFGLSDTTTDDTSTDSTESTTEPTFFNKLKNLFSSDEQDVEPTASNSTDEQTTDVVDYRIPDTEPECVDYNTDYRGDSYGRIDALEKHNISCPAGRVINSFKLVSDNNGSIRYDYKCCKKNIESCETRVTEPGALEFNSLTTPLKNIDVNCNSGEVLSELQLIKDGTTYKYKYTCCKIKEPSNVCENKNLNFENANNSVLNFAGKELKCSENKAISKISLADRVMYSCTGVCITPYQYNYECCS